MNFMAMDKKKMRASSLAGATNERHRKVSTRHSYIGVCSLLVPVPPFSERDSCSSDAKKSAIE